MLFLISWVLFGLLGAFAIWGISRGKRWGLLVAVIAAKLMANRAARAERLGVQVLHTTTLIGFVGVATNEYLKRLPTPPREALEGANFGYSPDKLEADVALRMAEARALLDAAKSAQIRIHGSDE